ncbi:MAG: NAD(P)-dependent oxidoreductase [Chromatiales bacterium]|nr:NAD(P)-dependent oxidoreductase [Chromatiales bacterium]
MTRQVLLTGGSGFVGRQVLRALCDHDVSVRIILREGSPVPFKDSACIQDVVRSPDIFAEDLEWWIHSCANIDTVIHVAWYTEPGEYQHSAKNIDCLRGTLVLAQAAAQAKVRKFVGIGTCFEYQLGSQALTVDDVLQPETPYAAAKAAAYLALSRFFPTQKVVLAWCRLFYLHGDGEDTRRLIPYIHHQLQRGLPVSLGDPDLIRDYMDVRDAADDIALAALGTANGPLNICSGVPTTIRQIAETIADHYNRRDLLRFGARPRQATDPDCVVGVKSVLRAI